jgi:hypothetical protein
MLPRKELSVTTSLTPPLTDGTAIQFYFWIKWASTHERCKLPGLSSVPEREDHSHWAAVRGVLIVKNTRGVPASPSDGKDLRRDDRNGCTSFRLFSHSANPPQKVRRSLTTEASSDDVTVNCIGEAHTK